MHSLRPRLSRPRGTLLGLLGAMLLPLAVAVAQVPVQVQPGQQLPTPVQAKDLLQNQPGLVQQLRQRLEGSGLTPDQVRSRLRAAGYPETTLDQYLAGADTTKSVRPSRQTLEAVRALGVLSAEEADSLQITDSLGQLTDSLRQRLDSLRALRLDSLRADSLADSLAAIEPQGLKHFGIETFRRYSTRFQPSLAGPVDENYRLGPGDVLVLILTGDVEQAYDLDVTREGFVVIPQVGRVYAANLTLQQFHDQLFPRLRRIYSGIRSGNKGPTQFQVSLAKLRTIQVYVAGDVVRPGAFQMSAAGTVLTALYAAGGPTTNGSFRQVQVRRGGKLVDSVDLYDYLLRGINRSDIRLQTGDVVFVPVHGGFVKVNGEVSRPATYEVLPTETLRDVVQFAGGFDPGAYRSRVQIHRTLPPEANAVSGRGRVVVDVGPEQLTGGVVPGVPMSAGDSVTVFELADRTRSYVSVVGNVWVPGQVGFTPGMKLSDAIRLAGGPKPDVYLDRILVARVREDSSMVQLRSSFTDSTGKLAADLPLEDQDEIRIFSRTTFRDLPYITVTGAVRRQGRVQFREGMTLRDAVLIADGVTEDAYLSQAEIARLDPTRAPGTLARTIRVPIDSSYRFGGNIPPARTAGANAPGAGDAPVEHAPEVQLRPFDNVLIMRETGFGRQRLVYLLGQVKRPGRYALRTKTDRVADLITRAGGLTDEAYAGGIQFYRAYTPGNRPPNEQVPRPVGDRVTPTDSLPRGYAERVGIDLPAVLKDVKFRDNIIVTGGDSIYIPEFNPVVMIQGEVNSPGPVAYHKGKSLDWYVNAAGGYSQLGDKSHPYVTQPDGQREGVKRRILLADGVPKPRPGATIFVPRKLIQEQASSVAGLVATAAQVLGALATLIIVARQ